MGVNEQSKQEVEATIHRVLDYIALRLDEMLTPSELAQFAGYSRHHFHRLFRQVVGESAMDHVRRLRMERAAIRLRETNWAIGIIGLEAGYFAHEVFTRIFRDYYGMSPLEYRRSRLGVQVPSPNDIHFGLECRHHRPYKTPTKPDPATLCRFHRQFKSREAALSSVIQCLQIVVETAYGPDDQQERVPRMSTQTIEDEIQTLEREVEAVKQRLNEVRRKRPPEPVEDYTLLQADGTPVKLSALFGDKEDLVVIHNMGTGCSYCTMWADGFTGLTPHISDRASFVLVSPDAPDVLKRFADKRNWNFRTASHHGTSFSSDMGFLIDGGQYPGVSTFRKTDGQIFRISKAYFDVGDDFCPVWPLLELLDGGSKNWQPKYFY